jgi:hypothetical protein
MDELESYIRREVKAACALGGVGAVVRMVHRINVRVEVLIRDSMAGADRSGVACGPGCPYCCVLTVSVLFPEAMAIEDHLRRTGRTDMLPALKDFVARIRWMEDGERAWREIYCPFLNELKACSIHAVRPLLCRSITSTDSAACRAALKQPEASEAPLVMMNMVQKRLAESAFLQLAKSLQEAGRDSRSVELVRGVSAFLEQPNLELDFVQGGQVEIRQD